MYKLKQQGFTLIEMAVVLVITGLLLSAVMSLGNTQIAQSRISTTKAKEASIKTALLSYIARNKRLPCPAQSLAPGVSGYGVEAATPGTCDGVTASGAGSTRTVTGVIPWQSLGLTLENAEDGYYNLFTYAVTADSTNLNNSTIGGMKGSITTHLGAPATAANQSNNCTPTGWTYNPCLFVVMIMSNGANAFGAYTPSGTRIGLPGGTDESANTDGDAAFIIKDFTVDNANPYDDILLPLSTNDLLTPLTVTASIQDYNAKLNDAFSAYKGGVVTYAATHKTGTSPNSTYSLPPNLATMNLPGTVTTDSWGFPITYSPNVLSISAGTANAIAYTANSSGPNGIAGDSDDITRIVYVSDLQAVFSTYGW